MSALVEDKNPLLRHREVTACWGFARLHMWPQRPTALECCTGLSPKCPRVINLGWSPAGCFFNEGPPTLPNLSPKISDHSPSPPQSRRQQNHCKQMARSKKSDDKPDESASLQISLEDFIRTRDSVSS